jgi:hypothetical protein
MRVGAFQVTVHVKAIRESKRAFWERMDREGRRAEAEEVLAGLLGPGVSKRQAQAQLVERFQPLSGERTCSWSTPDSWRLGRWQHRRPRDLEAESDEAVLWVFNNPDKDPSEAPMPGARWWMDLAKKRPAEFLRAQMAAMLRAVRRQQEEEETRLAKKRRKLAAQQAQRQLAAQQAQKLAAKQAQQAPPLPKVVEDSYDDDDWEEDEEEYDDEYEEDEDDEECDEDDEEEEEPEQERPRSAAPRKVVAPPAPVAPKVVEPPPPPAMKIVPPAEQLSPQQPEVVEPPPAPVEVKTSWPLGFGVDVTLPSDEAQRLRALRLAGWLP